MQRLSRISWWCNGVYHHNHILDSTMEVVFFVQIFKIPFFGVGRRLDPGSIVKTQAKNTKQKGKAEKQSLQL
ncbi:hypothetical protein Hanom_Chr16g01463611 [Helianthus anomalus]